VTVIVNTWSASVLAVTEIFSSTLVIFTLEFITKCCIILWSWCEVKNCKKKLVNPASLYSFAVFCVAGSNLGVTVGVPICLFVLAALCIGFGIVVRCWSRIKPQRGTYKFPNVPNEDWMEIGNIYRNELWSTRRTWATSQ